MGGGLEVLKLQREAREARRMLWVLYGRVGEMASDKVVQNAVQTLKAELGHIRKVLERIAVALERQVESPRVL